MTVKHILEGAMQHTKARNHLHLSKLTGIDHAVISRVSNGKSKNMTITSLDLIQRTTGVPIDTLFAWYRMPEGETLGRIGR